MKMIRNSLWIINHLKRQHVSITDMSNRLSLVNLIHRKRHQNDSFICSANYSTETNKNEKVIPQVDVNQNIAKIEREESLAFDKTYKQLITHIFSIQDASQELSEVNKWLDKIFEYNVPHGKRNRGLAVVYSYQLLTSPEQQTPEAIELSRIVGWCVELLQAYFLILDDVMDNSITRRNQLCWYRQEGVGLIACNDATLIHTTIFQVLKIYVKDKPYYSDILDLILEISRFTSYGQCLDLLSNPPGRKPEIDCLTLERYNAIVKYKTAFYSFILPVRLAMYMAEWRDNSDHEAAQEILLKMGHFFQVQDDYLDCYGDPDVIGKIGTDIEDGKCSWPIVMALQSCSPLQRKILQDNYGCHDVEAVARVKQVYNQLDIQSQYREYEEHAYQEICQLIKEITLKSQLPSRLFYVLLDKIHKRIK